MNTKTEKKDDGRAFWTEEYKKAKAGEKTIADTMSPEQLKEFKKRSYVPEGK